MLNGLGLYNTNWICVEYIIIFVFYGVWYSDTELGVKYRNEMVINVTLWYVECLWGFL